MDRLFSIASGLGRVRFRWDDDVIDRMSHVYSSILLVIFAILVSTKQYVGDPIVCWTPGNWPVVHVKYTEAVCWISNTYWIPQAEGIPTDVPIRKEKELGYYQWVPILLLLQALSFYFPTMFWRALNDKSGINLKQIIDSAVDIHNINPESRLKVVKQVAKHISMSLRAKRRQRLGRFSQIRRLFLKPCCAFWGVRYGNYLGVLYLLSKLLYATNAIAQLIFMHVFLGSRYRFYGVGFMWDLINRRDWKDSGRFPRDVMCDFVIRVLGNRHRHSIQCSLPVNMFNEKIYVFLWFWIGLVLISTVLSFLHWVAVIMIPAMRNNYIKKYLKIMGRYSLNEAPTFRKFTSELLRMDGVFIVRMIEKNTGIVVASEIVSELWTVHVKSVTRDHIHETHPLQNQSEYRKSGWAGANGDQV